MHLRDFSFGLIALLVACTTPASPGKDDGGHDDTTDSDGSHFGTTTDSTETDADTDSDTDSDTDADTDSDTDADTDSDTDTDPVGPRDRDDDGDGVTENQGDCDDGDANTFPGAAELESTTSCRTDADGDGYGDDSPRNGVTPGGDCADNNAGRNPAESEIADNGVDENCDGLDLHDPGPGTDPNDVDNDGDGDTEHQGDCNDANANIHPGATESCNSMDDDCDGLTDDNAVDADTWYRDADGDGYGSRTNTLESCTQPGGGYIAIDSDCDDGNAGMNPGEAEIAGDGIDQDCTGADMPAQPGNCFRDDSNCDGEVFPDADCDGHGNGNWPTSTLIADLAQCWADDGLDCDDGDVSQWNTCSGGGGGGGNSTCDDLDLDADGVLYWDNDGDECGNGNTANVIGVDIDDADCASGSWADNGDDWDDGTFDPDDCDGSVDPGDEDYRYCQDLDGDGYGNPTLCQDGFTDITPPPGWADDPDDCDDSRASVNPSVVEVPGDGLDNDCVGGDASANDDLDHDGWTVNGGDCDDHDALKNPGLAEVLDIRDNDCDDEADDVGLVTWERCYDDLADMVCDVDGNGDEVYDVMKHTFVEEGDSCPAGYTGKDGVWITGYPTDICTGPDQPYDDCVVNNDGTITLWGNYMLVAISQCEGYDPNGLHMNGLLKENTGVGGEYRYYSADPDMNGDGIREQFTCHRIMYVPDEAGRTIDDLTDDRGSWDPVMLYLHAGAPFYGAYVEVGDINPGNYMYSDLRTEGDSLGYNAHLEAFMVLDAGH